MDVSTLLSTLNEKAQAVDAIGATLKMVIDDNSIYIDGTGDANVVSMDDKDADCTISTSLETLMGMQSGDTNPMMAVMSGKVKISGDMGLAMKLQSLLS